MLAVSASRSIARASLARAALAPAAARSLHSTRPVQGAESTSSASSEEYPPEGFGAPIWRWSLLGALAAFGLYRISAVHADPHPSRASSSGRSAPGNESEDELEKPWLTRYIEHWTTPTSVWKERNLKHLELVREKAEEKLLFQDAERPPVHRLRYPQTFEQASPHAIPVGGQADLTDLKIKKSNE